MNAMLFAAIRGPDFTKQRLFEDWWYPPSSPKIVSTEAPKLMSVDGNPTRWWSIQATEWTYISILTECYAFWCYQGTKLHKAAAVWRWVESPPSPKNVSTKAPKTTAVEGKPKSWWEWMLCFLLWSGDQTSPSSRCLKIDGILLFSQKSIDGGI